MEILIPQPQIKEINFDSYIKYFLEALKTPDSFHILFYKKLPDGIKISFSWDNFIIICFVTYSKITELYKDQNLNTADITLSDKEEHPYLLKFYSEFLFNRGIPEV